MVAQAWAKLRRICWVLMACCVPLGGFGEVLAAVDGPKLTGIDNVPLMTGLREDYAFVAPIERAGERVAQASLSGYPLPIEVMDFYADALIAEGWRLIRLQSGVDDGSGTELAVPVLILPNGSHIAMYQTDTQVLTLTSERTGRRTVITLEVWAKDKDDKSGGGFKIVSKVH